MNEDILEILTSPGDWPSPGWKAILDALNTIFGAWITLIHYRSKWWPAEEAFREPSAVSQHSSGSACPESAGQCPLPASLGFMNFLLLCLYTVPKALNIKSSKENSSHTNTKGWMGLPWWTRG